MSDGSYFICSAGKDRAGNISPWTQSSQILVDTTGPTNPSAISITSDNPTNGSTVSFTYTAGFDVNFSTNRVKACTDSDCSTSCVDEHADTMSPETISGLAANTPYYICVRTEDSAATTSAWVASAGTIVTDTIAPSDASAVTITSTIPLNADSLDASYTSGDGSTHNVKACIDTSCSTNCVGSNTDIASPVTISGLQDGVPYYACIQSVDAVTNTANWVASDSTVTPDLTPNVTSVSSADANAYYKAGDTITITVQFDMAVTVVNNGDITLALETGTTDRNATYSSGSGTDTLSFSYSVQADDENNDLDYLSTTALAVNTSTIQGPTGINAVLTLAAPGAANSLGNNKSLNVDAVAPIITSLVDQSVSSIYSYDATASDNEGIDSWTWTKVSGTGDITFGSANAEDTTISSNTDGTFVIRLTVTDNAGNQVSDEMNFTWDETAPTVSVATQTVCDVTPDFSGNVNDNSATINVNVNGSDYAGTNNGDGTWSLAGTVLAAADTGIPSGTYNVTVTATDTFTNAATDTTSNELVINCSQFITTWTTSGASESVTLPLINGGTHEFVVDWVIFRKFLH